MDIGIGLPNTLHIDGPAVLDWARRAEERGFSGLATIDRLVYPTYDSLTALAAAAGATSRIGLVTDILLAPAYPPVWLAKATGSLHALSGGRLTLGVGVGGRADDFAAVDRDFGRRGALMDETLSVLRRAWAGSPIGEQPVSPPVPGGRVPLLIGGNGPAAVRRTLEHGDGWTIGGAPPEQAAAAAEQIRRAWADAGRPGSPRLAALAYFGLGSEDESRAALRSYYGFTGDFAETIASSAARTPERIREVASAFTDAGFTELYFDPTVPSVDQVDRLADIVL